MGDSAFGFSAMEYETLCRYRLDACVIVLNNNGITGGAAEWRAEWDRDTVGALQSPVSALAPTNQYEKITEMFGGQVGVGISGHGCGGCVFSRHAAVCCLCMLLMVYSQLALPGLARADDGGAGGSTAGGAGAAGSLGRARAHQSHGQAQEAAVRVRPHGRERWGGPQAAAAGEALMGPSLIRINTRVIIHGSRVQE